MLSQNKNLKKVFNKTEFYVLIVIVVIALVLEILTKGKFLTGENMVDIVISNLYLGIAAVGMLVVVISGGLDLSCLATATIAQYLMCKYLITDSPNLFVAFLIVIAVGVLLGAINGFLVYRYNVPSMIITIATMNTYSALLQWATKSVNLYGFPSWFSRKGIYGNWLPVIVCVLVIIVTAVILRYTKMGRNIYAIGSNMEGARRVGVNICKTQMFVYCYIGLLAGLAGLVQQYLLRNYSPNALVGKELNLVVMVVIGGAGLTGGSGSVLGTLLGVLLLGFISNGMTLLGISSYQQSFVSGLVILLGLIFVSAFNTRNRKKKSEKKEEA